MKNQKKKTKSANKAKHTNRAKHTFDAKKIKKTVLTVIGMLLAVGIISVCLYFIIRPYTAEYVMSTLRARYSVDGTAMELSCGKSDYGYFFAFPEGCDFDTLTFEHRGKKDVFIGDTVLKNEETAADVKGTGQYKVSVGKRTFDLIVMSGSNMPVVYIETESGALDKVYADKEYKEAAELSVFEGGKKTLVSSLQYIKGRGNSTWECPQKSFSIKFTEKTDLLGLGKAKKYSLLTSWYDSSYICSELGYTIAEKMECSSTPSGKSALLYVNDEYCGIYCVSEPVKIGKERIDIIDMDEKNEEANPGIDLSDCPRKSSGFSGRPGSYKWAELPSEPDDPDGGYLLELDRMNLYKEETAGFVTADNQPVVIKSPEYASRSEVEFIRNIWTEAVEALYSETGYNSLNRHYSEYFDTDSLVSMLLFQEFAMQTDVSQSSCFFYYDSRDRKIYSGPVWDLDYAFLGDCSYGSYKLRTDASWFAAVNNTYSRDMPAFFSMAARHPELREAMFAKWQKVRSELTDSFFVDTINDLWERTRDNCVADCLQWNKMPGFGTLETMAEYLRLPINDIENFCCERAGAFDTYFKNECAVLYYESAEGGYVIHSDFAFDGDTVYIISDETAEERLEHPFWKRHLKEWNTAPDGSGDRYHAGDGIKISKGNNFLYAQWK